MKLLLRKYFTISLIGRPNVGKSTLFNLLAGSQKSLVHNLPGLTRDRIECYINLYGAGFKVIDTPGWDPIQTTNPSAVVEQMKKQTRKGLEESDAAFFIIDAREGITNDDLTIAELVRKNRIGIDKSKVILIANKAESSYLGDINNEVFKLGLGEPIYISAQHNENIVCLYEKLRECVPNEYIESYTKLLEKRKQRHNEMKEQLKNELSDLEEKSSEFFNLAEWSKEYDKLNAEDASDYDTDSQIDLRETIREPSSKHQFSKIIQVGIIGKPNVGKSTMVNTILKSDRVITDSKPGTTRDSIYLDYVFNGRKYRIVDTAGLNKRQKSTIDQLVHSEVMKCIRFSHAMMLLFDCSQGLSDIELNLAQKVIAEGRILLLVGNKWDLIEKDKKNRYSQYIARTLHRKLSQKGVFVVFTSGKQGYNIKACFSQINSLYSNWIKRVSTGLLNRWLEAFTKVYSLPSHDGNLLKIKFISQIKIRPPTFYMYVNDRSLMTPQYYKHFSLSLCKEFNIRGVPIRMIIRDKHYRTIKKHKPGFKIEKAEKLLKSTVDSLLTMPGKSDLTN